MTEGFNRDWRSWEGYSNEDMVSVARAVDLDVTSLSAGKRQDLELEARTRGLLEGEVQQVPIGYAPLSPPSDLGDWENVSANLRHIQVEAGQYFAEGDERGHDAACYAWHANLCEIDVWPATKAIHRRWTGPATRAPDGSWTEHDIWAPFDVAEELSYGRFVYDSWLSVFELERYFYNWVWRCGMWLDAGPEADRWVDEEKVGNGMGREGAQDAVSSLVGLSLRENVVLPDKLVRVMQHPLNWLRKNVPLRAGRAWSAQGGSGLRDLMTGEDRFGYPGPIISQWESTPGGIALFTSKYLFSWHEFLIRIYELERVARFLRRIVDERLWIYPDGMGIVNGLNLVKLERRSCVEMTNRVHRLIDDTAPWLPFITQMWALEGVSEIRNQVL